MMVDNQPLFRAVSYLADMITSQSLFIQLFLGVLPMELSRDARLEVRQPTILAGRKQMLVCSAARKVHASRGAVTGCE